MRRSILCASLATSALAALYNDIDSLPNIPFDFVIAGGGTAGNVVANRLTENPSWNVLVIEGGPTNEGVIDSIVPFFALSLRKSAYDWNYTTVPQTGLNGRLIDYARGHILGGSSSINSMLYTRGSASDYDGFAKATGDSGWSWDKMQPYIRKNEKLVPPADNHNTTGQFIPSLHVSTGIHPISLNGFPQSTDQRVIQTLSDLPDEFPFNQDQNSGNSLGVGWQQTTVGGGTRSTSATSYLGPTFINRPNLHVVLNTRVTRILKTSSSGSLPTFRTIEFARDATGPRRVITASKEVILSAGAFGSPHLLMISGIGDQSELQAVGVKPIVHLPDVGKNMTDHALLSSSWRVNSNDTVDSILNDANLKAQLFEQWQNTHTGPLVGSGGSHMIWSRLPANSPILKQFPDPSTGPDGAHYELIIVNGAVSAVPPGSYIGIHALVSAPISRGFVKLKTSNPFDLPLVDPAYMASDYEVFTMREAVKASQRFLAAPAWKDYVIEPAGGLKDATTDAQIDQYVRQSTASGHHAVGTSSMSAKGAKHGVVDPDLRVKGVSGLRVVDASVMPYVPTGHTQIPTYVVAERGADLIKAAWV